jgi:hypothetical protein
VKDLEISVPNQTVVCEADGVEGALPPAMTLSNTLAMMLCKGGMLRIYRDQGTGVQCIVVRETAASSGVSTWGSVLTGDTNFETYASMRDAYNVRNKQIYDEEGVRF